ncbi:MAG: hypothetical protein U9M89_01710 [Patescibacteria group bacterium]|nr:hypothetical protein [Patescibacteria group bacterium]
MSKNVHRTNNIPKLQRIFSWFLSVSFLFIMSFGWLTAQYPPQKARATGEKMVLLWDTALGGNIPTGWTNASATYGGYFLRGDTVANATASSSPTHSHDRGSVAFTSQNSPPLAMKCNKPATSLAAIPHSHDITSFSMDVAIVLPVYRNLIAITYDSGIPTELPQYAIALFDAAVGTGFSSYSSQNGKMIRIDTTSGGTGGSTTHTHTNLSITSDVPDGFPGLMTSATDIYVTSNTHTHSYTATSPESSDHTPKHTETILGSVTSSGGTAIPVDMIAMFNGDPNADSANWDVISDSAEAFGAVFIEAQSSYQTGQGSATHDHTLSVTSSTATATAGGTTGSPNVSAIGAHAHTISGTFASASNDPPYINVVVAKKSAAYVPEMNNWRWYADEADAAVDVPYANENTVPPQIENGKSIPYKLRINLTETGGLAENDSRKILQWSTSTGGPWTAVAAITDITPGLVWKFYDGGGTDGATIPSKVLSDSSAVSLGTHNEAFTGSQTNSDHPASTTVEWEFSFYSVDSVSPNVTYYFNIKDEVLDKDISLASGKSYPQLTTASSFALSIDSPSSVAFGDFQLGNSQPFEYDFSDPTETIVARDNRGSAAGWSLTAAMNPELRATFTAPYCGSVNFTGSGLDDMTVSSCDNTLSAITVYKVEISSTATPNVFLWYSDGESLGEKNCSTDPILLEEEVYIVFENTTGHTAGNYWEFTAYPEVIVTIEDGDTYWITNTITGVFDASTTGVSGETGSYMGGPITAATATSTNGIGGFEFTPSMQLRNLLYAGSYAGSLVFTFL